MQTFKYLRNFLVQTIFISPSFVQYLQNLNKKAKTKIKTCFNLNIPVNVMHKAGIFAQAFDKGE